MNVDDLSPEDIADIIAEYEEEAGQEETLGKPLGEELKRRGAPYVIQKQKKPTAEELLAEPFVDVDELPPQEKSGEDISPDFKTAKEPPTTLKTQEIPPAQLAEEVDNLQLIENVFDKRVNDQQIETHKLLEANKNTSARLLDKKDIELKSDLNNIEIVLIAKARMISFRYEVPMLYDFCDDLMTLKVSRERKGRGEFIQGLHADEKRDTQPGLLERMFGRGGQ